MERINLRAAASKLNRLHGRFAKLFGRCESQRHSQTYVRGLLLAEGRKSVEPMALVFASHSTNAGRPSQPDVLALQRFLTLSPWEASDVQAEIERAFVEEFVPSTCQWPLGTVGIIDESAFPKQGAESVGVARQWCGRLGKKANCQVGVFLVGVTPAGSALLQHRLFLPQSWVDDGARRKKTRVPQEVGFQSKVEIAADLLQRTRDNGAVTFDWVVADEGYGRSSDWYDWLDEHNQRYLIEIPVNMTFAIEAPQRRTPQADVTTFQARKIAGWIPAGGWTRLALREGAKGPLVFEFARLRVWDVRHCELGNPCWLLFRRPLEPGGEIKYYKSNAGEETSLETMALVSGTRYRVEEFFEDGKGELGLGDYEARSWTSWHHHMTLVALAHFYVQQVRQEVQRDVPELTLEMALRIVRTALDRPTLTPDDSLHIINYHLTRNKTATASHRKTWLRKHKHPKFKPLL